MVGGGRWSGGSGLFLFVCLLACLLACLFGCFVVWGDSLDQSVVAWW